MTFNPNATSFEEGLQRIGDALGGQRGELPKSIVTSLDEPYRLAQTKLVTDNVPGGFTKFQLPVFLKEHSQFYVSEGEAGAAVPTHSHDEGDGLRYMISGSIHYGGKELKAGDWMFIPAKTPYSFTVGAQGAKMFYCYCCSCAGGRPVQRQ